LKYHDDSINFFLTVEDIFNLKLEADLIVLSACVTGMNTNRPGDELIGLTRAFIYAGTPSVIASLWHSYSDSTLELIRNFYKYWNNSTEPMSKAKALQKAQIELIHNGQHRAWRHPYHWALFILIGDWL
jgi:CHAT domain-containing protein